MATTGARLRQQAEQQNAIWWKECQVELREQYRKFVTEWLPNNAAASGQFSNPWDLQRSLSLKCYRFTPQLKKELRVLASPDDIKVSDGIHPGTVNLQW